MKRQTLFFAAAAIVLVGSTATLNAQSGNFGADGSGIWKETIKKRIGHKDGDINADATVKKEMKHHSKAFKQPPQEVIDALNKTFAAIEAIDKDKISTAEKELKEAIKLFDNALKTDPALDLVPIDQTIEVKRFDGTINDIKADINLAVKLLKSYRTQSARDLLLPLEEEIDITTHYLPMQLYPKAAKKALKLLKNGKKEEALLELQLGLGTITADEIVIPIPLLDAQVHLEAASKIYANDKEKAIELLNVAKRKLQRALLLGYTDKDAKAYEKIYKEIVRLQKEIKEKRSGTKLFERLKKDFESLLHRTREEKKRLEDSDSVWKGTAKAHAKAAKEEIQDRLRFQEKMESDLF